MKKFNLYFVLGLFIILTACGRNEKSSRYSDQSESAVVADTSSVSDSISLIGPKLVKTAEIRMKVPNVEKARQEIYKLTTEINGMVIHQETQTIQEDSETMPFSADSAVIVSSYQVNSLLTVRVPSEKLEDFMNSAAKLAVVVDLRSVHVEDKTLDFLAANEKNKNRLEWLKKQNKDDAKKTELDIKNEWIDDEIAKKRIDLDVPYSTIDLTLYQSNTILKERIANTSLSNYRVSFWSRFGYALSNGWSIFADFIVGLANAWVFVLVVAVAILGIRYYSKNDKKNKQSAD